MVEGGIGTGREQSSFAGGEVALLSAVMCVWFALIAPVVSKGWAHGGRRGETTAWRPPVGVNLQDCRNMNPLQQQLRGFYIWANLGRAG
ncbi:hypothetical protein CBR_g785 [Chara braunii]|uniref:Uncharacterized protein n=1 Tax=Chara braunii TaxID=69332 RepID=A0A388KCB9_CHABU|nr:hypothetical protein CBR_g785 [Chara braunii]|eukprot:GBG67657.1 hypothetical protein CBR_g785 [Chara braunii]